MNTCPSCGAVISERLVRQILDSASEESCPRDLERRRLAKKARGMEEME